LNNLIHSITSKYNKQGLWLLFLMCVFPQHLWTLIFAFRDISWLISRTNVWDAIGNTSYGMVYAFFESVLIFCVLTLVGFFTPSRWEVNRRVAFLTLLLFITSLWGMVSQLLYLWNIWLPLPLMQFIANTGRPLVMLYLLSLAIVVPTVSFPVFAFVRWDKTLSSLLDFMDRLTTLSMLYLFFDVIGLIIVVIRNVS
jgi:hypothetical protein